MPWMRIWLKAGFQVYLGLNCKGKGYLPLGSIFDENEMILNYTKDGSVENPNLSVFRVQKMCNWNQNTSTDA